MTPLSLRWEGHWPAPLFDRGEVRRDNPIWPGVNELQTRVGKDPEGSEPFSAIFRMFLFEERIRSSVCSVLIEGV